MWLSSLTVFMEDAKFSLMMKKFVLMLMDIQDLPRISQTDANQVTIPFA